MTDPREMVTVRYMVDDVEDAVAFYTKFLDFEILSSFGPAVANVARGNLRLLLSGPTSSAARPMPDGAKPGPGGWNRIHLIVDDIGAEVARLRDAGARFRNDVIEGPGAVARAQEQHPHRRRPLAAGGGRARDEAGMQGPSARREQRSDAGQIDRVVRVAAIG